MKDLMEAFDEKTKRKLTHLRSAVEITSKNNRYSTPFL